jgi:hypothetical protein
VRAFATKVAGLVSLLHVGFLPFEGTRGLPSKTLDPRGFPLALLLDSAANGARCPVAARAEYYTLCPPNCQGFSGAARIRCGRVRTPYNRLGLAPARGKKST